MADAESMACGVCCSRWRLLLELVACSLDSRSCFASSLLKILCIRTIMQVMRSRPEIEFISLSLATCAYAPFPCFLAAGRQDGVE